MRPVPEPIVHARRQVPGVTRPLDEAGRADLHAALSRRLHEDRALVEHTLPREPPELLGEALAERLGTVPAWVGLVLENHGPAREGFLDTLDAIGRGLDAALEGARTEALGHLETALATLGPAPQTAARPDPDRILRALTPAYDRHSGRSRYDSADLELDLHLRCVAADCARPMAWTVSVWQSERTAPCPACGRATTLYLAPVVRAERDGTTLTLTTRDRRGPLRRLHLELPEGTPDPGLETGDLVALLYDDAEALRLLRNLTRETEVWLAPDKRCFVATAALGPDAPEVLALRQFRERRLRPHPVGRALIAAYETVGPAGARLLTRWPVLKVPTRTALRRLARLADAL